MTLQQLNSKLTIAMKGFIRQRKHIVTGHLLNSIKFRSTFIQEELKITFNSKDYIVYLEDGKFVSNFFNLNTTENIIEEFIQERVQFMIEEELTS
jgi:hypothetical protein